jgi:ABC-2 type transport system permease protein
VVATARETRAPRTFGVRTHARQAIAVAGDSFRAVAGSWAGIAMLVALPLLTVLVVLDQTMSNGVPMVPTTPLVLAELTAPVSAELSRWVIVPLLLIFFAGELVWREREAGLGEIGDALPGSDWAPLLGKLLALALLLAAFLAMQAAAGMAAQALRGHHDFQIGLYATVLFGLQLPEYLLFAVLALAVHVAVDQKYVGHLVAVVAYVVLALASLFGIEHDLLVYGAGPSWSYSEMRGFGPSLAPWAWFRAYWAAWAILLAVAARLLWVRGHAGGMRARLREARRRMTGGTARTAAGAAVLVLSLGGFIFHNTNVRHTYLSGAERAERSAEYERRYRRFAGAPQPRLATARLRVEIHPRRGAVEVRGRYRLVNRGDAPIDTVHVAVSPGVETGPIAFDRPATLVVADEALGHRIYALAYPLGPGDALAMDFHVRAARDGFAEDGADASVAENGTYFTNGWLPAIGYQGARELVSAADRRAHGLAPRPLIPFLEDEEARKDRGGGIDFEAVVGTDAGQTAVAPGALRGTWTEGGRRYFRYASDAPIGGEWSFFSAVYGVREVRWTDPATGRAVAVRILHHPGHTAHLDRMARAVVSSLGTYARHFGPYPYGHLTVVERPGTGTGMHADAAMVSHGEGFTWWNPSDGPRGLDFPSAVVAHEVAHHWTVPYAAVEGAPVMSEGIAWYHAILAVEEARGKDHARRLLHYLRQPHPIRQIRRGEPLLRGLDPYLSRRRAPFALYALREYAGGERVNGALRRLVETHRRPGAPRATTLDLYRELQAATPDSLRPLLHDLFEINAFWEMETEAVRADSLPGGAWRVTLEVRARKTAYDAAGTEREMPLDEWLPVGVFGAAGAETGAPGAPLYLRMHRVRAGRQTITVTVPRRPVRAGLDPHHLLDWGEETNVAEVRIGR